MLLLFVFEGTILTSKFNDDLRLASSVRSLFITINIWIEKKSLLRCSTVLNMEWSYISAPLFYLMTGLSNSSQQKKNLVTIWFLWYIPASGDKLKILEQKTLFDIDASFLSDCGISWRCDEMTNVCLVLWSSHDKNFKWTSLGVSPVTYWRCHKTKQWQFTHLFV